MNELRTPSEVGECIASERRELGLSQAELAARVGITRERLAGYEKGRGCLRCGIAFDICRNLVISEEWLATGKDDKNGYLDIAARFPKKFLNKSFLDLYQSHIAPICDGILYLDGFMSLFRYGDLHPDTWRIACFKEIKKLADNIKDQKSRSYYWREVAAQAGGVWMKYREPPEERLSELDKQMSVAKNGQEVDFSYRKLFADLSLIGLDWDDIESIANSLKPTRTMDVQSIKERISIEQIKEGVLHYLDMCDLSNAEELYRKIHCKN